MLEVIKKEKRTLKDPAPRVIVEELGDNSVNFTFRAWIKADDYLDLELEFTEAVKKAFDKNGISIPFPQRDVHIYKHD